MKNVKLLTDDLFDPLQRTMPIIIITPTTTAAAAPKTTFLLAIVSRIYHKRNYTIGFENFE